MANTSYFHRFVDIVRSPMGKPLLAQLAASDRKLGELLAYPSVLPASVPGAPETPQASALPSTLAPGCNSKARAGHVRICSCLQAPPTEIRRRGINAEDLVPRHSLCTGTMHEGLRVYL